MRKIKLLLALTASMLLLGACAGSLSSSGYSRAQARQEQTVRLGVVDSVRQVQIAGTQSPVGTVAGALVGGIAGSSIGQGKGSNVGAVLGAVAGGLAGSALEESTTRKPGLEITVKLDNGQIIAVTQEADETFSQGDRVRVLSGNGVTRVAH